VANRKERPILSGLVALVVVAAAIGLFLGLGAMAATNVLGLGGGGDGSQAGDEASMYLPEPEETTASPEESPTGSEAPASSEPTATTSGKPERKQKPISLSSAQSSVAPMEQIDLTGSYPGADGEIVQVQRYEGGSWESFPVTAPVNGGSFSTYIQTGQTGPNKFRVIDTSSGKKSNAITVRVG
jgi:hypothetical protein